MRLTLAVVLCLTLSAVAFADSPGAGTLHQRGGILVQPCRPPAPMVTTDCTSNCGVSDCFELTCTTDTGESTPGPATCAMTDAGFNQTISWQSGGSAGYYTLYKKVDAGTYGLAASLPQGAFPMSVLDPGDGGIGGGAAPPTLDLSGATQTPVVSLDSANAGLLYETDGGGALHVALPLDSATTINGAKVSFLDAGVADVQGLPLLIVSGVDAGAPTAAVYEEIGALSVATGTTPAADAGFAHGTFAHQPFCLFSVVSADAGAVAYNTSVSTTGVSVTLSGNDTVNFTYDCKGN